MLFSVVQLFKHVYMFIFIFCIGFLLLCVGFFSSSGSGSYYLDAACRLLVVVASLVLKHRL